MQEVLEVLGSFGFLGGMGIVVLFVFHKEILSWIKAKQGVPKEAPSSFLTLEEALGGSKSDEELLAEIKASRIALEAGKPLEVDAGLALFLIGHEEYDLFQSESGKIMYEKMQRVCEASQPSSEVMPVRVEDKKHAEFLSNGHIRVMTPSGYVVYDRNGVLVNAKAYEDAPSVPLASSAQVRVNNAREEEKEAKAEEIQTQDVLYEMDEEDVGVRHTSVITPENVFTPSLHNAHHAKKEARIEAKREEGLVEDTLSSKEVWSEEVLKKVPVATTGELDAKSIAKALSKSPSSKEPLSLRYEASYRFLNFGDYFKVLFLSHEGQMREKLLRFFNLMLQRPNVFFVERERTLYIHIESFMLSFAGAINEEDLAVYFQGLYPEGEERCSFARLNMLAEHFNTFLGAKMEQLQKFKMPLKRMEMPIISTNAGMLIPGQHLR